MDNQAFFPYFNQQMFAENVPFSVIAKEIGTPFYCYSNAAIKNNFNQYKDAFSDQNALICYAVKANSNQAVLKTLAELGAGADVVSLGEIKRVLSAGIKPKRIVYSGVAKTEVEIEFALSAGIFQFNVESEPELQVISKVAQRLDTTAAIAFRINPDVTANTHAKITTGKSENKFGIPISKAREAYKKAALLPCIKVQGVDVHIGSQLTNLTPYEDTFVKIAALVCELRQDDHDIQVIDIGGGLGIDYGEGLKIPDKRDYAKVAKQQLGHLDCKIIIEPGRSIMANAGVLVTKVVYLKKGENRQFLILDAAMNDLIRPSMYEAHHDIVAVDLSSDSQECYDIVGPVCETGDTFAKNRIIAKSKKGDLLAIMSCGAYGAVMSSTYNTRLLAPEVMVKGDQFSVIRKRLTYDELIAADSIPSWL